MSLSITFEAEPFELSTRERTDETCQCPKCRASRDDETSGLFEDEFGTQQDEAWEDFAFENEYSDEVPLLQKGGAIVAAQARQVAAIEKARQATFNRAALTAEKTCWVQNVLNRAEGETLKVDGIFGPITGGAVLRFQTRQNLVANGTVDQQTETALIQTALNSIARASMVPVNGVMDPRTLQEIRRFQSQQRLLVDGIVGPITRGAMITALGGRRCYVPAPPPRPSPTPKPTPTPSPREWTQGCNRTKFDSLVADCDSEYRKCLASRCGLTYVINQLKLIPELAGCAELTTAPLIILCALAKGGKEVIDNIINAKACKDTCASNADICRYNAGSEARCR